MKYIRAIISSLAIVFILILGISFVAKADIFAPTASAPTEDKTVLKTGEEFTVYNNINGDLFCFGQNVAISGIINGDVFCAAENIDLKGIVNGSVRLAGDTVKMSMSARVSRNVSIAANNISIGKSVDLNSDLHAAAQNIVLDGSVGRDFSAIANDVKINGTVGRDVNVKNASLTISNTAAIGGNVFNNTSKSSDINKDAVLGKITSYNTTKSKFASIVKNFFVGYAFWFISLLIISFAVLWLFPKPLVNSVKLANNSPVRVLATGLIVVFIVPILLLIICLTIVGIPLALLLGLIYIITLSMSGPFFAFLVGSKFLPERKLWIRMLLGSTLVLMSYSLPVIGFFVALVVGIFGSGMFATLILERLPEAKHPKSKKTKTIA